MRSHGEKQNPKLSKLKVKQNDTSIPALGRRVCIIGAKNAVNSEGLPTLVADVEIR
jgi:hypothetical protein